MNIITIHKGHLYSVRYEEEDENEFDRLLDLWNNMQYLVDFFEENKTLLSNAIWNRASRPETAALQVTSEAQELETLFDELAKNTDEDKKPDFDNHFKYLGGKYKYLLEYEPMKSYGTASPSLIRLYAIKLQPNTYLITGGGIKLADTIQNSPGLKDYVIGNIDKVRHYLTDNGIMDSEDLEDWDNN